MRKYLLFALLTLTLIVFGACSSGSDDETATTDETKTESTEETSSETITITHELGETEVQKNPEKVIVFDFGMLDTLDHFGIDVVGLPQMAVPSYLEKYTSDEYENLGSLKEPDFEKIDQIRPDIIIISSRQAELYDELSKLGPVVYVGLDYANYIESFKENLNMIGQIFDIEDQVNEEIAKLDERINGINEKANSLEKNALILLANDNKISAYGEGSRYGFIHDEFGIPAVDQNIEASTHGMNVTFEYVLENDPDIIYVIDRSAAIGEEPSAKAVVENELIQKTKAMQNDDIYYLDPEVWYLSGGGLISMNKMIDEIEESLE